MIIGSGGFYAKPKEAATTAEIGMVSVEESVLLKDPIAAFDAQASQSAQEIRKVRDRELNLDFAISGLSNRHTRV
jgi:hypothetical protein